MAGPRAIDTALDFARMPALAQAVTRPPLPPDLLEVIKIAAGSVETCRAASAITGQPVHLLEEAARFYLQHALFRPGADSYRVLGLQPGASREVARNHMRWLLEWLHPDRNGGLDAVYAERVLKAWREVSTSTGAPASHASQPRHVNGGRRRTRRSPVRLPWIERPVKSSRSGKRTLRRWIAGLSLAASAGLLAILGLLLLEVPTADELRAFTSAIIATSAAKPESISTDNAIRPDTRN